MFIFPCHLICLRLFPDHIVSLSFEVTFLGGGGGGDEEEWPGNKAKVGYVVNLSPVYV